MAFFIAKQSVVLSVLLFSLSTAIECHDGCKCSTREADCSQVGIDPQALYLDQKFIDLNFTGNNVGAVRKEMYKLRKDIQFLWLKDNGITEIASGIFDQNLELVSVDLSHNMLRTLPLNLFRNNLKLQRFNCRNNRLTEISESLFRSVTNLREVYLDHNKLVTIPPSTFVKNRLIHRLYLQYNQLQTAYWKWIGHFNHTETYELFFDNNPWSCDCRMKDFRIHGKKWLKQNTGDQSHRADTPRCNDRQERPHIFDVIESEFVCQKPTMTSPSNCTTSDSVTTCSVTLKEGSSGKIPCTGGGKPIPQMQLRKTAKLHYRNITKLNQGSASYSSNSILSSDAGTYICMGVGFDATGKSATFSHIITVNVELNGSPVLGIVLGLLFFAILVMVAAFYYQHRYKKRAGYGSLSKKDDTLIHYDVTKGANMAQPTEVTYMEDENAVIEEVNTSTKDDEKEVLV